MKVKRFLKYFISVLTILVSIALIYIFSTETIGFNKTVGWAWDMSNINFWVLIITYALLLILMISIVALFIIRLKDNFSKKVK